MRPLALRQISDRITRQRRLLQITYPGEPTVPLCCSYTPHFTKLSVIPQYTSVAESSRRKKAVLQMINTIFTKTRFPMLTYLFLSCVFSLNRPIWFTVALYLRKARIAATNSGIDGTEGSFMTIIFIAYLWIGELILLLWFENSGSKAPKTDFNRTY